MKRLFLLAPRILLWRLLNGLSLEIMFRMGFSAAQSNVAYKAIYGAANALKRGIREDLS